MKPTPVLVATDFVLFGREGDQLFLLLIQRLNEPFKDNWALPGGFLDPGEDLEDCAIRELREETNVKLTKALQVGAYGHPERDPRGRVISIAFTAVINKGDHTAKAADDAKALRWFNLSALPDLAFDHHQIVKHAYRKLMV